MSLTPNFMQIKYQQNIAAELVKLVYSQAMPALFGSLIVACALFYVLYGVVPQNLLVGWFALTAVISLTRFALIKIYFNKQPPASECTRWANYFIVLNLIAGSAWALLGTWLMPIRSIDQTFIACSLAGIAAAAIPYLAGSRAASCAFIIPVLLPFAMWGLLQADSLHQILGLLTLLYLSLLLISCFRTHQAIYDALKLKFENMELVALLTTTQQEMTVINQTLQAEVNYRANTERLLRDSEAQYRLVTDALPVLISYVDTNLRYRFINKAYTDWFGEEVDAIIGKAMRRVIGDGAFVIFKENIALLPAKKVVNFETIMSFRNQEERYVSVSLVPNVVDEEIRGFFSLISDMTPRINFLATHDTLTNLPNRSLFTAKFSQALKNAQRANEKIALLFLDIDHFKNINDTLGHDVGDILLKQVTERIQSVLREKDMLARLGGDEFIILIENITNEGLLKTANRICHAFIKPFVLNDREVYVTSSVGVSVYPDDGQDMQILLKNADMATYRAKERGRNTFEFYTEEMNKILLHKIQLEAKLRAALANHEFILHYQPVMDIPSNSITSLEALLRWNHPGEGIISPQEFIPVAEETGLIVPIGEWVIRSVCEQNNLWRTNANFPVNLRISINISSRQFSAKNLVQTLRTILAETKLSGDAVVLELTESLIMHDIDYSNRMMKSLKDLGITLSIDDFGTGYSSLNYLRRFPIDILKIDKSFIADITKRSDEAPIVNAIIAMAHSLRMKVIAEGVETLPQYYFLKDRGCDEIQGFLLSKPVPPQAIALFLKRAFSVEEYLNSQTR